MYQTIAGVRCRIQPSLADVHKDPRVREIDALLDDPREMSEVLSRALMIARGHVVALVTREYRIRGVVLGFDRR